MLCIRYLLEFHPHQSFMKRFPHFLVHRGEAWEVDQIISGTTQRRTWTSLATQSALSKSVALLLYTLQLAIANETLP